MSNYKQLTIDYLEGRISPADYEAMVESDDGLFDWIQNILPEDKTYCKWSLEQGRLIYYPYNIREVMQLHERLSNGGPKGSLCYHHYIHEEIANLMQEAFPELQINIDPRPDILHWLEIRACPRYIGGTEVAMHNILGKVLEDIPLDGSESARSKIARERIKAAFHVAGNKYPHWIQEPEWPVYNGKPMKYVKTTRINSEAVRHQFLDEESGTIRYVLDSH